MIVASPSEEAESRARRLQEVLLKDGITCLVDDREVSLGERFRYAGALGLPYQVVVPSRAADAGSSGSNARPARAGRPTRPR